MKKFIYLIPLFAMLTACSPQTYTKKDSVVLGYDKPQKSETVGESVQKITIQRPMVGMIPKATAFKMSGDYADKVAITLNDNGTLAYYPAPTDISMASVPTSLGNGWYLNNQGISSNSVFTKYTYEEYSKLPSVPTQEELKAAIIPGARVIDMIQLPYSINEAKDNIPGIKDYINSL